MDTNSIKASVVESYGKLAKATGGNPFRNLFACCEPGENAQKVGEAIGYSEEELKGVPANSNLGVGCGNPAALANIRPGEVVVDLGSGAGFDAFIVSQQVGPKGKVIGVDLSPDMLKLARKNAKSGGIENVEFREGDIESLPLEAHVADHVISNCVINLSAQKDKVYAEAYRILRPGGRISVSDIVLEKDLPSYIRESLAGRVACISGAEPLDTYLDYIRKAGFKKVRIEKEGVFPLEILFNDPMIRQLAKELNMDLGSSEAADLASRVKSISVTAIK